MALQNSFSLPASATEVKALNSWPICFLSICTASSPMKNPLSDERREGRSIDELFVAADDGDARHVLARRAAEIVGHADLRVLELARAGPALELQVHLVEHAQARGTDRMAEALEAAVDLAGDLAVGIVEAVEHVLPALAGLRDVQVFHGHELGDREAVVHLEHRDFLARILDAGFLVGL